MNRELSRRNLLKLLATLPMVGMAAPAIAGIRRDLTGSQEAPNVLILVFDALSAKNVSLYGYPRETMPNLARLAERATVYHAHYAGGNHTSPGVASLLTGTYPWSHRAFHLHGTVDEGYLDKNLFRAFSAGGYHTIAYSHNLLVMSLFHQFHRDLEVLKRTRDLCLVDDEYSDVVFANDYNVSFWSEWLMLREGSSPPASLILSLLHRMLRFGHKRELLQELGSQFPRGLPHLHSLYYLLEPAIDWLQDGLASWPQPFLAYVHLLPPHEPYTTRREFVDRFRDGWVPPAKEPHHFSEGKTDEFLHAQRREYDEYIAYADAELGRLYDGMLQSGALDDTYLVVTSDHGEMFERGIRGHVTPVLYEPVVRVPLLIAKPGQEEREDVHTVTSAVDLLPTLLQASGMPAADWSEGEVLPTFEAEEGRGERSVYVVEAKSNPKQGPVTKGTVALVREGKKLIHCRGYEGYERRYEFYDLQSDPEELEDLYPAGGPVAGAMVEELEEKLREVNGPYLEGPGGE